MASSRAGDTGSVVKAASGDPAYVAAYGISQVEGALSFEVAFALAKLVLRSDGGPVLVGKSFPKRMANALLKAGLIEMRTEYELQRGVRLGGGFAADGSRLVSAKTYVSADPGKRSVYVVATAEAIALVREHAKD